MIQDAVYERQNKISSLQIPQAVSVVGCGGTGFWTAVLLAMSGVKELILVDPDRLDITNLNRLPLTEGDVGRSKVVAAKEFIERLREPIRIELHESKIEKPEDCSILRGMVFCCTDNLKSQQLICAYCRKNGIPYQRIGYDGTTLNVSKSFPLTFEQVTDEGGYSVTPSWVVPAVFAAAAGVSSRLYKEVCLMDDIATVHTQGCSHICPKFLDEAREEGVEQGEENILDNIHDHIPDGYGYCEDCSYSSPETVEEIRQEEREQGVQDAIAQIESGNIENPDLQAALETWKKNQEVSDDE